MKIVYQNCHCDQLHKQNLNF